MLVAEAGDDGPVVRIVSQDPSGAISIESNVADGAGERWLDRVFRPHDGAIAWGDPIIGDLAATYPGLRSFTDGSLYLGLVTSIIGQSVSIASAMAAQGRLAASLGSVIEVCGRALSPLADAGVLADAPVELIRASGVTWKRAEALKSVAMAAAAGMLPDTATMADDDVERALRDLPLVGPWTAASAMLWGIGAPDAFPSGDVALLRAARLAYNDPAMTMKDLNAIAEGWRPYRAIATRLLWTNLLGPAW